MKKWNKTEGERVIKKTRFGSEKAFEASES